MGEKKTPMGADPLAWLTVEDKQTEPVSKPTTRRRRVTKTTKSDAELVVESFAVIAPQGDQMAERFYIRLFEEYPQLMPLFESVSIKGQQKKLLASLVLLVQNLHKPEVLNDYLKGLGARHEQYGVIANQYPMVAENLLSVFEEFSGGIWTTDVKQAWTNTLDTVMSIMQGACIDEGKEVAITEQETKHSSDIILAAIEGGNTAIMMCDKDLVITYVNPAVIALLANRLDELHKVFPALDLGNLVGTCIDDFSKEPSLQRSVLAELDNLPYNNQFQLLDIHFDLTVTAILNADGEYAGNMIEWRDITDQKRQELKLENTLAAYDGQLTAIDNVMGVISFAMDGTIIDCNENFLTMMGYSKEEVIGQHHRMFTENGETEYDAFWTKLNQGKYDSGEYKWMGQNGREVWLQASYNPILDLNGKPFKVVKYALDITANKELQMSVQTVVMEVANVMNIVSAGDLTPKLKGNDSGEPTLALLQSSVNDTIATIATTMTNINKFASTVSTVASEISEGNIDLSLRTEEQAASLEQTAASMEELTLIIRQNSDSADQAKELTSISRKQAEKAGLVIKEAIAAMSEICVSSHKVSDIISVIDEIAFQTNLLALNAAVEAARAGEQGRGFAVVASEVRNLAQRSASAAKEIKTLIKNSGEKVKEGSMLVDESGRTLEEIVNISQRVGDLVSDISATGIQQTKGIEQVNQAVTHMDDMTHKNAALVEQATAASEVLSEQTQNMQRIVSFYKMERRRK
ncbi:methyl-accepting chemotaxis protein [Pseudomonadota bacterium]|nr:methyl-accepting chemotaxis protein [Pseudomonadota bacterium]